MSISRNNGNSVKEPRHSCRGTARGGHIVLADRSKVRIVTDDQGGPMVVAQVVRTGACKAEDLIDHCARNLAPYKVPRQIEFCEQV